MPTQLRADRYRYRPRFSPTSSDILRAPLRIRDLTEDDWLNGLWPSAAMLAPEFPGVSRAPIELFSASRPCPGDLLLGVLSHRRGEAVQLDQTAHVVGEVLQPYPSLCPRQPDTTQQRPAHVVALGPENMLDADPNGRTGLVALLLALAQRLVAAGFAMDPASSTPSSSAPPRSPPSDKRCPPIRPRPCCPHPGYRREPYCRASPRRSPDSRRTSLCRRSTLTWFL